MRKKILALLLGGAMAIGGLSMQVPITAQAITSAECDGHSEKHINYCEITDAGGPVEVEISVSYDAEDAVLNLYALETQLEKQPRPGGEEDYFVLEQWQAEGGNEDHILKIERKYGLYYVFSGLTGGKTYHIYGVMMDRHGLQPSEDSGEHYSTYLGSVTPVCGYTSEEHITGYTLTPGAGQLTVTIGLQEFKGEYGVAELYALENKAEKKRLPSEVESVDPDYHIYYDWLEEGSQQGSRIWAEKSGAYTFTGLKEGKTYYVYAIVYDPHFQSESESVIDEHDMFYLGSNNDSSANEPISNNNESASNNNEPVSDNNEASNNSNEASNSNNEANEPAYEATENSASGEVYVVKSGDCLWKIAAAHNMTLKQLVAKNPQIKNPNIIYKGQKINL